MSAPALVGRERSGLVVVSMTALRVWVGGRPEDAKAEDAEEVSRRLLLLLTTTAPRQWAADLEVVVSVREERAGKGEGVRREGEEGAVGPRRRRGNGMMMKRRLGACRGGMDGVRGMGSCCRLKGRRWRGRRC
jgi:hypothetical protein